MPTLGEIVRPKDIGKKGTNGFIWHACIDCGKEQWVQLKRGNPRSLRCKVCCTKGKNHPNWRGGRTKTSYGYVRILVSDDRHKQISILEAKIKRLEAKVERLENE